MDFTQICFPFKLWIVRPTWECALKIGFFVPVVIVSLFGNSLVIYLMATNRFLRTSTNIFIWNLAIADLLTILLLPWIILTIDLYQMFILGAVLILTIFLISFQYIFIALFFFLVTKAVCHIEGFLRGNSLWQPFPITTTLLITVPCLHTRIVTLMLVDVFSLLAVSFDRFFTIVFPFRPKMGHIAAYITCGFIWILSTAIASPLIPVKVYKVIFSDPVTKRQNGCINEILFRNVNGKTFLKAGASTIARSPSFTTLLWTPFLSGFLWLSWPSCSPSFSLL